MHACLCALLTCQSELGNVSRQEETISNMGSWLIQTGSDNTDGW